MPGFVLVLSLSCLQGCKATEVGRQGRSLAAADQGQGPDAGPGCGAITAQGCCQGQVLTYCASGQVKTQTCQPAGACGWNATYGLYTCGTSGSSDPAGLYPRACPKDGGQDAPASDALVDLAAVPDHLAMDAAAGACGALGFAGCCQGQTVYFCSAGKVLSLGCQKSPHCGWNAAAGFYDCGTSGQAEPTGKHPKACGTLLGDAGLQSDSGPVDQAFETLSQDAIPLSDLEPGETIKSGDAFVIVGDRFPPRELLPVPDLPGRERLGLDLSTLEGGRPDLGPSLLGGSGCDCRVGHATRPGARMGLLGVLLLGVLLLGRRLGQRRYFLLLGLVLMLGLLGGCGAGEPDRALSAHHSLAASDGAKETGPGTLDGKGLTMEGGPACGAIPALGCCDGQTLWFCAGSQRRSLSCATRPLCGWSAASGRYDCNTSGQADPSGTHARSCGPYLGDGALPKTDGPRPELGAGCGTIGEVGCCAKGQLLFCEDGALRQMSCALNPACGWSANGQIYDCGTQGLMDPSGVHPRACPLQLPTDLQWDSPRISDLLMPDVRGSDGAVRLSDEDAGCGCGQAPRSPRPMGIVLWVVLLVSLGLRRRALRRLVGGR